jgi:hypothetical protein
MRTMKLSKESDLLGEGIGLIPGYINLKEVG